MKAWTRVKNSQKLFLRLLSLMLWTTLSVSVAIAQTNPPISGKVTDNEGESIIGASIISSEESTITDMDGMFKLNVPIGTEIEVSYLGFNPQKIKITNLSELVIKLQEDDIMLGDVVVIAYGVQKKESLTGAISNIVSEDIVKTKAPSVAQAIQGKVAGLRIRQQDGEPGQFRSDINVRGLGTPLFIIDGIVRDGADAFQRLNPEDIESISFLKDGTAAIYGMNSVNGAIIVTTKKGTKGKTKVTLSSNFGIAKPTDIPKMATAAQYMTMRNDAAILGTGTPLVTQEELALWQQGAPGYEGTNLYDDVFKNNSMQHQHTISIQGGSDNITYFGSLGYARDESLLRSNDLNYDKYTVRTNTDIKIARGLTAGINLSGRKDKTSQPWNSFFEIFKQTRINVPTGSAYANNNPNYLATQEMGFNPIALADSEISGYHTYENKNFQSTFSLTYDIPFLKGLSVRGQLGYDYNQQKHKGVRKKYSTYSYSSDNDEYIESVYNDPSLLQVGNREATRLDLQTQINYSQTFNGVHNVGATFVFERKQEKNDWSNIERKYDLYTFDEINYTGIRDQIAGGMSDKAAFLSYVGRVNYDFMGKYLIELAFRQDGSYRYPPGSRWTFYPTGSIGWRVSEEKFIKDRFSFIDNFKLRASYGKSAQDAGHPFQHVSGYNLNQGIYEFTDGSALSGIGTPSITNPYLTWIKSKLFDVGFDLSLFNGLASLELDLYQRDRSGLLTKRTVSLPNTYGADLPEENLNSDMTRGIEITLGHRNKIGNVSYNIKGNMNLARTQMKHVERGPFTSSWDRWRNQSANRWNDFVWGYETLGQFTNGEQIRHHGVVQHGEMGNSKELPGDYIFKDVNGDGIIDEKDQLPMFWSGTPLIHYGITMEASWNHFDIYALFQGSGMYTVQFSEVYAEILWSKGSNTPAYFYDRWHKEDSYDPDSRWIEGKWPASRLIQDVGSLYKENSDIWRKNASYLRLKTIELGYTVPNSLIRKAGIENLRFYVNGYNLLTFADSFVKPFDPERIEGSYSAGLNYPLTKSFNFGFTANF